MTGWEEMKLGWREAGQLHRRIFPYILAMTAVAMLGHRWLFGVRYWNVSHPTFSREVLAESFMVSAGFLLGRLSEWRKR